MSTENETNKCKQRFKGVENFLRRVAFNLGNTPSQTEVKIISCIPIDVTDLQQKIIQLERQLEDAKTTSNKEETKSVKSAKSARVANGSQKQANDTKDTDDKSVANGTNQSNGANKPNGAKLPSGSKESDAAKPSDRNQKANTTEKRASAIHTALCKSTFPRFSSRGLSKGAGCCQSNHTVQCDDYNHSSKNKKSAVSFIFPIEPTFTENYTYLSTEHTDKSEEKCCSPNECRRNFFRVKKKQPRKKKNKTHLVYYAQTSNTPFNSYEISTMSSFRDVIDADSRLIISQSYLSDMIRKQYKPISVTDKPSGTSQFSSPVCRDVKQSCLGPCPYESDVCSCCHGKFQNIDHYITSTRCEPILTVNDERNSYYDSSMYDLVPVKENSVKVKKELDVSKRKELKVDIRCWPEKVRAKPRHYPIMVNYHTKIRTCDNDIRKNTPCKLVKKRDIVNKLTARPARNMDKLDQQTGMESSKSCSVDFGSCYPKGTPKFKAEEITHLIKPSHTNAECWTTIINNTDCQTIPQNVEENKTKETLTQIKSILQSVLTEVKTNSKVKSIEDNAKKDAFVQKGASQNNIQEGSSLMNSFTYSPYNISPHGPSCSRQMPSNQFCYYGLSNAIKPVHNYPLLIHTPGRHMCTSCFRNSQYKTRINNTTTATNTEEINKRCTNETEKLIKEIYRSIDLDIPTKDTSRSDYDDLKPIKTISKSNCNQSRQEKESKQNDFVISEIFRNPEVQKDTSVTRETNTTIQSYFTNIISSQSQSASTDPEIDRSKNKINNSLVNKKVIQQTVDTDSETDDNAEHQAQSSNGTTESSDSETLSSDTECDGTVRPLKEFKEYKKKGLFRKIRNFFNRSKKKKDTQIETEIHYSSASDSDDYQTIYSQKIEIPQGTKRSPKNLRPRTKIINSKRTDHTHRGPDKFKRIPYMDQEYIRYWNEKLMFHDNRKGRRYSSEQPLSNEIISRIRQNQPVYYQNYETRSVLVDPLRTSQQNFSPIFSRDCNRNEIELANGNTRPIVNFNSPPAVNIHRPAMNIKARNKSQLHSYSPITIHETRNRSHPQYIPPTNNYGINQNASNALRNIADAQNFPTMINRNQDGQHNISVGKENTKLGKRALKGLSWLKKHKLGTQCGEQWKKFILEN